MNLGEFFAANLSRRREAGVWDCCTLPAEWALAQGRADPMAHWRGRYASEAEGIAYVRAAEGGLVALFDEGLRRVGYREVETPEPGDIAVVRVADDEAGVIYAGKRWALVAERGLAFASIEPHCIARIWSAR